MRLNTLGASPSFAAWLQGPPLEVRDLLATPDGRPRASVISIAHLPDAQRQAVVSLVLGRLITWMRAQPERRRHGRPPRHDVADRTAAGAAEQHVERATDELAELEDRLAER